MTTGPLIIPTLPLGHLGYRGMSLLLFGTIWVALGVDVILDPSVDPNLWHTQLWLPLRVAIWGGAGVLALIGAFFKGWWEILGFTFLFVGPFERCLSYIGALIWEPSITRLTGVIVYLLLAAVIILIASWPEAPKVART